MKVFKRHWELDSNDTAYPHRLCSGNWFSACQAREQQRGESWGGVHDEPPSFSPAWIQSWVPALPHGADSSGAPGEPMLQLMHQRSPQLSGHSRDSEHCCQKCFWGAHWGNGGGPLLVAELMVTDVVLSHRAVPKALWLSHEQGFRACRRVNRSRENLVLYQLWQMQILSIIIDSQEVLLNQDVSSSLAIKTCISAGVLSNVIPQVLQTHFWTGRLNANF